MILKGKLCLNGKDDYIIFSNGRIANLTDKFNVMLFDNVRFAMKNMYDNRTIVDVEGKLIKQRVSKYFYLFHIDNVNVDSILWNLVGSKVEIELKNVTMYK